MVTAAAHCRALTGALLKPGFRFSAPKGSRFLCSQRCVRAEAMPRLDSHLHVWAPADAGDEFPFAGALIGAKSAAPEPPMPGHVEVLLDAFAGAGVEGALIVQPGNHLYDHKYVTSVLKRYPDKFVGCLLADPTEGGGGAAEIERLVMEEGYKAVRFNPYLWPEGEKMTNEVGRAMYAKAGELGCPVGHMPFKGFMKHFEEIETLIKEYPNTKCIIDHFGFCKAADPNSDEWKALLSLAQYPNVYVKTSAFFRISGEEYPYADAKPCLRALLDAFGPQRCMWGSDFPWVTEQCGYTKAWSILDDWSGEATITEEEKEWLLGKTLASLFPGSFGQSWA